MTDFILLLIGGSVVSAFAAWFTRELVLYRLRFKGRVYDPARDLNLSKFPEGETPVGRIGARRVGVNRTGRVCASCGTTTWGLADACGACGRRVSMAVGE